MIQWLTSPRFLLVSVVAVAVEVFWLSAFLSIWSILRAPSIVPENVFSPSILFLFNSQPCTYSYRWALAASLTEWISSSVPWAHPPPHSQSPFRPVSSWSSSIPPLPSRSVQPFSASPFPGCALLLEEYHFRWKWNNFAKKFKFLDMPKPLQWLSYKHPKLKTFRKNMK